MYNRNDKQEGSEKMDQEKIGKFIKEIRIKNNLTQKDLAEKYGVTYQAVSKWENGKNIPDIALLKQMSQDFHINIEDILNGSYNSKKKHSHKKIILIFGGIILALLLIFIAYILFHHDDSFEFRTISSRCEQFTITGSIAYNSNISSIYISDITYCGEEDNTDYKKIECTLYEKNNNTQTEIQTYYYEEEEITKLDDFLKTISFRVDDYPKICETYDENNLYLEINATDENDKITSYQVPLSVEDNC